MSKKETRQFKMHPKLLFDVIQRQAGTLAKAILEAIMNAVDAAATKCDIKIEADIVTITDDGKGFRSRKEIESWFEVFGQPHEESENKRYGTFRMGRGQMFAFGRNRWSTGKFQMEVDIKTRGLDYELSDQSDSPGCAISILLYSPLYPSDIAGTIRSLEHWVKWCPIPVTVNGDLISQDPEKEKWTFVTDDAYIKIQKTGDLSVYNLGIHVRNLQNYEYGCGGTVVSRRQLKVNFARNDIQSDCPVWTSVKKLVDQKAAAENIQREKLTDGQRRRLIDQLLQGEIQMRDVRSKKLLTAATGRHYPLNTLASDGRLSPYRTATAAEMGNRKADHLMKSQRAFVVATETLGYFRVKTIHELVKKLASLETAADWPWDVHTSNFADLIKGMEGTYMDVPVHMYSADEQLWVKLLTNAQSYLEVPDYVRRVIGVGISDQANGWTDGTTYININRKWLKKQSFDVGGVTNVGRLLLHEMCHDESDLEDHSHDQAFYENFHDSCKSLGRFVNHVVWSIPKMCESLERKMNQRQLAAQDKIVKAARSVEKFQGQEVSV